MPRAWSTCLVCTLPCRGTHCRKHQQRTGPRERLSDFNEAAAVAQRNAKALMPGDSWWASGLSREEFRALAAREFETRLQYVSGRTLIVNVKD